jgi:glycerophosphoryl diester phosphodiesterase
LIPKLPLDQLLSYKNPATISDEELKSIKEYVTGVRPNFNKKDEKFVKMVRNHNFNSTIYYCISLMNQ